VVKSLYEEKKFLWLMAVVVFVGGLGLVLVWYNLNQRLNRPEFQANLEREISEALEGKISFASVRGQLGFRPWIGLGDIKFVGNNGDLRATAKELRVAVKVLPLLRQVVVFSQIEDCGPPPSDSATAGRLRACPSALQRKSEPEGGGV
jgi:uncharacterized protein involved in outer membrane biogenesis